MWIMRESIPPWCATSATASSSRAACRACAQARRRYSVATACGTVTSGGLRVGGRRFGGAGGAVVGAGATGAAATGATGADCGVTGATGETGAAGTTGASAAFLLGGTSCTEAVANAIGAVVASVAATV